MPNENATKGVLLMQNPFCIWEGIFMDLLERAALEFDKLRSNTYYFEIARKNTQRKFMLNFMSGDFHHIVGLHKLPDIRFIQTGARDKVYKDILHGRIGSSDIQKSKYYGEIENRLKLVGQMGDILDSNQIVFKCLKNGNVFSRIEADYLLENAHKTDIIYIFLNERSKAEKGQIPVMCCRSFFPMNQLDYSRNQPSYTLLKKVKIDTISGNETVQYDRSRILDQAKEAGSEAERKSVLQQLNEKKAQSAIKEVIDQRRNCQKDKQDREK